MLCREVASSLDPVHSPGLPPPPAAPPCSLWPCVLLPYKPAHSQVVCLQDAQLPCSAFGNSGSDLCFGSILLTRCLNVPSCMCVLGNLKYGLCALVSSVSFMCLGVACGAHICCIHRWMSSAVPNHHHTADA